MLSLVFLPGFLQSVAPLLDHYGYGAVALLLVLEDFGIPVPGETTLIAAAIYAGTGRLNVVLLLVIAVLAAVIGDNIGFAIGHYGGEALIHRYGRYLFLNKRRFNSARDFFNRHGGVIVVFARFFEGLRQLNGIIAGTSDMRWQLFLVYNVIGAALWAGTWITFGYVAGNHIATIYHTVTRYEQYALVLLIVVAAVLLIRMIRHRRR
ncbi:MAG TPA: DedA family protein [Candidatus Saccharimonadales bacterium]|nr:DedA family protein [Candidatus Saccharimonadales bacterium]